MQRFLAVAALCVASVAMPVLPTQAAPTLSDAEANCLIFPMFKKDCWELGAAKAKAAPAAVVTTAAVTTKAASAAAHEVKLPLLWNCSRAPAGSGHLLDC
jgi:hypothetical protein